MGKCRGQGLCESSGEREKVRSVEVRPASKA